MKVVFSDRAYAAILSESVEKIETETGGLFLGTIDGDTWYVIETIDPGPESVFEVAYFEYDKFYTQHLINKIAALYNEKLTLIGLWHRHPGSFDVFSRTDDGTNTKYAGMRKEGAISALVNVDPKFRLTVYHVTSPCLYNKIKYEVGNNLIPDRYLKLKTVDTYENMIRNIIDPHSTEEVWQNSVSLNSFMKTLEPLFKERRFEGKIEKPSKNPDEVKEKIINSVLSDIMFMSDEIGIKMSVVQKNSYVAFIQDSIDGVMKVFFAYSEPNDEVFFQYDGENYIYEDGLFETLHNMVENKNDVCEPNVYVSSQNEVKPKKRDIINMILRFIKSDRSDK